jgi:tetratricopeptide (TPR) repeat protein|tara:strand:- start:1875 stop:2957 length:1083 start_codon:yes stop_codon:yes gene_type:complete
MSLTSDEKDYIFPLLFIYRAYGYIVLEEYDKGLKDFIKSSQIKKLNASQNYNMILCQGLKNFELKEFENAISFFGKAAQKQSKKRDPFLLRAMAIVQYTVNKPIKPKTKIQMLKDAKKDLHRALEQSPKDESVLFLRGILNFALHRFYDAISDFERVIEKAEETNAIHYLARGRCYACLSMFKEAITDLSIAINLNKDLLDAYLNRGKCAYLIGDTGLAFMDFQKLIVLEPKNPSVHIYAGNLLMTTGSYEDATKAFTNADNIQKSPLALYQRSRCHVALNNMAEALDDLNKVIEISMTDKVAIQDRECLNALKSCSVLCLGDEEPIEKVVFQKAAQAITKLISYEKNEHLAKLAHESSI